MHGYTLLELLIATSLGLLITLAALSLYRAQRYTFEQLLDRAQMAEAGSTALYLISAHLRLAGFASPLDKKVPNPAVFGCKAGYPVGTIGARICKSDSTGQSDGLEISYLADPISTWVNANNKLTDCLGQAISSDKQQEQTSPLLVNRFFARISPSTGQPELYCEGNGRPGIAQPVVEGIERLRVRYRLADTVAFIDATAIPPNQWHKIATVELCVIARGTRATSAASYLNCDGARTTPADALRRYAFTSWVTLRNASEK